MSDESSISYTDVELESYLPAGWNLSSDVPAGWDAKQNRFRFTAIDTCDMDWKVDVDPAEAREHGRIEALRRAVDRLYRLRFKSFV